MSSEIFMPLESDAGLLDEYRLLIEAVGEYAIFLLDTEGRVTSWNRGAERIKGYQRSEIVGQSFTRFYPLQDIAAEKPKRELEIAAETGSYQEEGWRIRKNGQCFWANVLITALRGPRGELRGFGKVTHDLTDRRAAEQVARDLIREQAARLAAQETEAALRTSEQRFRELSARFEVTLEGVTDGITVQDRSGRVVYANSAAARQCGLERGEQLVNLSPEQIRAPFEIFDEHGEPFPTARLPGRRALLGEDPAPVLLNVRESATGRRWWSIVRSRLMHDPGGQADLVVNIWSDVTYRQRQLEASHYLANVAAALSTTLEHQDIARVVAELLVPHLADWCTIDILHDGHLLPVTIAHVNPEKVATAGKVRERYPERLDGTGALATVLRTGRSELYDHITPEMIDAGAADSEHAALLHGIGMRSVIIVPLRAADRVMGALSLISAESGRSYDKADLALAEELGRRAGIAMENARLYREAQRAVKLRDEFLSIAGHELRTPLTALNLQLQGVLAATKRGFDAGDGPKFANRVGKAIAQSERLEHLIRELLDVARVSSGRLTLQREAVELSSLVSEVIERHGAELARAGSSVSLEVTGDTTGFWDASRLDQVVTNLLANAAKYGKGTPIKLRADGETSRVVFTIADSGIGVPKEHQTRIFERFERAVSDRHYGGLGLGLWIVREIVRAHGGDVRVLDTEESGATFQVELPRSVP